jgi:hypothetical protein
MFLALGGLKILVAILAMLQHGCHFHSPIIENYNRRSAKWQMRNGPTNGFQSRRNYLRRTVGYLFRWRR